MQVTNHGIHVVFGDAAFRPAPKDIKKAPTPFSDNINLAQGNRHGIHDGRTSSDDLDLKDAFL